MMSMDFLGRVLLTVIFTFLTTAKAVQIWIYLGNWQMSATFAIDVAVHSLGLAFMVLMVILTVLRLPPKSKSLGWWPRIAAISGSFLGQLVPLLPLSEASIEVRMGGIFLIASGLALSLYCLVWLGRSFSIDAQARRLVTHGPYALVRHPLYLSEAIFMIGIGIANPSLAVAVLLAVNLIFQYWRARNEELVLRATFPEYAAYSEQTPMLVPWSRRARIVRRPS